MKRLLLIISIALAFVSCDNPDMENDEDRVTVTFETFGGTEIAPLRVRIGTPIGQVIPKKDPAKAEHEFEGWFNKVRDGVFSGRVIGYETDPINSDITLYAKLVWYYPFEVSDVTHEYDFRTGILYVTWTIPDDENFSHVNINGGIASGVNSAKLVAISQGNLFLRCVDVNGNYSKGIEIKYEY